LQTATPTLFEASQLVFSRVRNHHSWTGIMAHQMPFLARVLAFCLLISLLQYCIAARAAGRCHVGVDLQLRRARRCICDDVCLDSDARHKVRFGFCPVRDRSISLSTFSIHRREPKSLRLDLKQITRFCIGKLLHICPSCPIMPFVSKRFRNLACVFAILSPCRSSGGLCWPMMLPWSVSEGNEDSVLPIDASTKACVHARNMSVAHTPLRDRCIHQTHNLFMRACRAQQLHQHSTTQHLSSQPFCVERR
jgi:hypothetical protein